MKDYQPTKKYFQKVFLPLQCCTSVRHKQRGKFHAAFCQRIWKIQSKQKRSMIVIPPMVHIVYCNSCIINRGNGRLYTYGWRLTFHYPAYEVFSEPSDRECQKGSHLLSIYINVNHHEFK